MRPALQLTVVAAAATASLCWLPRPSLALVVPTAAAQFPTAGNTDNVYGMSGTATGGSPRKLPGAKIQALVDASAALPKPAVVQVPPGDYDFGDASLRIFGTSQLTVRAAGGNGTSTTLWFACGRGVHIANSSDVRFEGFTQDYVTACFAQGELQEVGPASSDPEGASLWAQVKFDAEHFPLPRGAMFPARQPPPPPGSGPPPTQVTVKLTFWDPATTLMVAHGNHLVTVRIISSRPPPPYRVIISQSRAPRTARGTPSCASPDASAKSALRMPA